MRDLYKIQKLVGSISQEQLADVDCYVCDVLGVFVPSTGYCKYAITPNHTHPGYMFNVFLSGEQNVMEHPIEVSANQYPACVMSPEIPHTEETGDKFNRYYAIVIAKEYFSEIYTAYTQQQPPEYIWHQFAVNREIIFLLREFMQEYEEPLQNQEILLDNLAALITNKLVRALLSQACADKPVAAELGLDRAEHYLQQNFDAKISLQEMAQLASMSVSYFEHIFKETYGCSPTQYLQNLRIEKAKKYLRGSGKSMTEIALSCGFASAAAFSANFRKMVGIAPSDYRKSYL